MSGPRNGWPVSQVVETPESTEEEKKVVVTVANLNARDKMLNLIDICKFSRLGELLRVTSWVKRFLFNFQAAKKRQ